MTAKVIVKNVTSASATTQENSGHTHHWVTIEDTETIPAVTQKQEQCLGCKQWFNSLDDIVNHAMKVKMGIESGDPQHCGSVGGIEREVEIEPAKTIVTGTHEECDICHARR